MFRGFWLNVAVLLGIILVSLLAGCSGNGANAPLPDTGDVTITEPATANLTMQTGQDLHLAASVVGDAGASIGWTVKTGGVEVPGAVSGGIFTIPATAPAWGSAVYAIEAYNIADPTKKDSITVNVLNSKTNTVDGAEMVWVPAGQFQMGRDIADTTRYNPYRENSESPEHPVKLSGYWMYKNEVTIAQYKQFTSANPAYWRAAMDGADNNPVANVKHSEALAYAAWAGGNLPTEAQWEKAARGAENRAYPWGNSWVDGYCNLWQNTTPPVGAVAVGTMTNDISQYGVMDLGGNVSEWCRENFGLYPSSTTLVTDPDGSANTSIDPHSFAVRGGSWGTFGGIDTSGRTAERSEGGDGTQAGSNGYNPGIGFRCMKN